MSTVTFRTRPYGGRATPAEVLARLGIYGRDPGELAGRLPFTPADATLGVENELQAVVEGSRAQVDLPRTIESSRYFENIIQRRRRGDLSRRLVSDLEHWLADDPGVWENSWVRLPLDALGPDAARAFETDLLADKSRPERGRRTDAGRFFTPGEGGTQIRLPISYLIKLALLDAVGPESGAPEPVRASGRKCANHYLSDNTSPETCSFHLAGLAEGTAGGRAVAGETARRFLLTQLLVQFAGHRYRLIESGQRPLVYFAPHPPLRQKRLNDVISDSFYRELFMNPCLSGWERGEEKHRYMHLCHQVLSRASLNALSRLREAGIITNNLVIVPSTSNISLANNGTHISLGSQKLTGALAAGTVDFGPAHEKYLADLVIKFVEHFLPLFVGTYAASPYRLGFTDFHPERVLAFLPYELDYTHLRMIWRRWRKKARLKSWLFGLRMTPFGPPMLDRLWGRVWGLKGDYLPDYRLLDYLVAVMSTDASPALSGRAGNQDLLKKDLADLGLYDPHMPLYLLYRQREYDRMGFTGFEGRQYSLFHDLESDLGSAAQLQALVTALAYHMIATGHLDHDDIPDTPEVESERRQVFFGAAIDLPTFFVRKNSGNRFLNRILIQTEGVRPSRRYPGFLRVRRKDYLEALATFLEVEGRGVAQAFGAKNLLADLRLRVRHPETHSAFGRLTKDILNSTGAKTAFHLSADEFNRAAEHYYRDELRRRHFREAWDLFLKEIDDPDARGYWEESGLRAAIGQVTGGRSPFEAAREIESDVMAETAGPEAIQTAIHLLLLDIRRRAAMSPGTQSTEKGTENGDADPPVCRSENG
jgi:hypothetical protein